MLQKICGLFSHKITAKYFLRKLAPFIGCRILKDMAELVNSLIYEQKRLHVHLSNNLRMLRIGVCSVSVTWPMAYQYV